ncbi:hypothetical protein GQ44DRAFT_728041 [Phaeosphaeriaceae sp. PMI808]|nr:hypothetical protein GQ44DRAFT_728041 [Phaeosphaeriaceae sp. PMI808]
MLLKALHPTIVLRNEQLNDFLSSDENTAEKLGPCQATEFDVVRLIGWGVDGLVLECCIPHSDVSVALKLLFKTIETDIKTTLQEAVDCDEVLHMLGRMCANGWVAIRVDIRQKLRKILPPQQIRMFVGDMIVGIAKPFFKEKGLSRENLAAQMRTMSLMRALGWGLRDVQDRNWINGCLVDGGDVETCPLHPRYLQRSWETAFYNAMKQAKAQPSECRVEEEPQDP